MSESVTAAPGSVVSETEHATTYEGATAASFEGIAAVSSHIVSYSKQYKHLQEYLIGF